jgi:hypothetical protein
MRYLCIYLRKFIPPHKKKILIKEQSNECFRRWVPISLAVESQSRPQRVGPGPLPVKARRVVQAAIRDDSKPFII